MRDEIYGVKLIQKYQPDAVAGSSDLVSAKFSCGSFRATFPKMNVEERNSMRERHWFRDPSVDTWVYCPPYFWENSRNSDQTEEPAEVEPPTPAPITEKVVSTVSITPKRRSFWRI